MTATTTRYAKTYDHRPVANLPEYHAARLAIDTLVHAMARADVDVDTQDDWIEMVGEMARSNVYGDWCDTCALDDAVSNPVQFPKRIDREGCEGQMIRCTYVCPLHGQWHCWWAERHWEHR